MSTFEGITSLKNLRLKQILSQGDGAQVNNDNDAELNNVVDNFRTEFLQANPHLKDRLSFLQPTNENGIKKFVCTFLSPTLLPYSDFFDLNSAADFVARYVTCETLCCDDSLGQVVVSPSQTLDSAAGDCFDISFLLASLLLGAGYDAFVVFGKAPKWIRLKYQSHQQLILTQQGNDSVDICIKDECFTNKQSTSEDDSTHCWVLVKAGRGKKDVEEDVFVEASTGVIYPVDKSPYSKVDSVCNDKNCLVNVGEDNVDVFDFDNSKQWVSVLPETYTLPTNSWTKAIGLPKDKFFLRYPPNGKRVILLEKAKIELFCDKFDSDGCVKRITQYEDTARTVALESIEIFSPTHRTDHMIKQTRRPLDNMHHEYFSVQQQHFITERMEISGKMSSLKFLPKSRVDGLVERVEQQENGSSAIITEHFINRSDNLVRREIHVTLLPNDAKPKELERFPSSGGAGVRVIKSVHEHFESTDDTESVACRSFLVNEGSVREVYHAEHEVLQTEAKFSLKDVGKGDSYEKEISQMMAASLSSVKKIQSEMLTIRKSLYDHEMKIVESTESLS